MCRARRYGATAPCLTRLDLTRDGRDRPCRETAAAVRAPRPALGLPSTAGLPDLRPGDCAGAPACRPVGPARADRRPARRRSGGPGRAARHRQDDAGAARPGRAGRRAGSSSPSRGGWRPGPPPGGWARCSASRSAGRSATPCAARAPSGPATRVEVVTTGVLVRRLQRDPELRRDRRRRARRVPRAAPRHRPRAGLRASTSGRRCGRTCCCSPCRRPRRPSGSRTALGGVPVVEASGALHPVEVVWCPPVAAGRAARTACGSTRGCSTTWPRSSAGRYAETTGDVLVFLPGAGEIGAVAGPAAAGSTSSRRCTAGCRPPRRTPRCGRAPAAGWCWRPRSPRAA